MRVGIKDYLIIFLLLQQDGLSIDEIQLTIKIINQFILADPLPENELRTILRNEAFLKESFFKKGVFLHDRFANF